LQDNATSTIVVVCTTHITKDIQVVWKWFERDPFVTRLLNARARFKLVVWLWLTQKSIHHCVQVHVCDKDVIGV
jgi:hypothetical protein